MPNFIERFNAWIDNTVAPKEKVEEENIKEPTYPCGYQLHLDGNLVVIEDGDDIMIWCDRHQAKTYWKKGRPDLKRMPRSIRPTWAMDIKKINEK